MRSPQSEVTPAPKAPATPAAEGPASRGRGSVHPRDGLLQLQRRYGNRHVGGIIQQKRNTGPVDDPLEREADRIALPATASSAGRAPEERTERVSGAERLRAAAGAGRHAAVLGAGAATAGADVFVRRSESRPGVAPGDVRPGHESSPTVRPGVAEVPSATPVSATTTPTVQRSSARGEGRRQDARGGHAPEEQRRSLVHKVLRTPGRPLDAPLRTEMEARFGGADFSGVRVHSDSVAQRSAREIQAKAYTSGPHVVDGGGMSKEDWAHELTHYLDQRSGPVPGTDNGAGLSISDPSDRGERRAVENARRVMSTAAPVRGAPAEHAEAGVGARSTEGGSAPVQRVVDPDLVEDARQTYGIKGDIKIVQVPDGILAGVPFADYPVGYCFGLSAKDLRLSVADVTGYEAEGLASAAVDLAGGGGYQLAYRLILVNDTPSGEHTVEATVRHEMGHVLQDEVGFNIDQSGGRTALVEYHNVLVNENRFIKAGDAPRYVYNTEDETMNTSARETLEVEKKAAGINERNLWKVLEQYLRGHDDEQKSQQQLFDAIEEELTKSKYDKKSSMSKFAATQREKIKKRIANRYFNYEFKQEPETGSAVE